MKKLTVELTTKCVKAKTAINRFFKKYDYLDTQLKQISVREMLDNVIDMVEDGLTMECKVMDCMFPFEIKFEQVSNGYYISLVVMDENPDYVEADLESPVKNEEDKIAEYGYVDTDSIKEIDTMKIFKSTYKRLKKYEERIKEEFTQKFYKSLVNVIGIYELSMNHRIYYRGLEIETVEDIRHVLGLAETINAPFNRGIDYGGEYVNINMNIYIKHLAEYFDYGKYIEEKTTARDEIDMQNNIFRCLQSKGYDMERERLHKAASSAYRHNITYHIEKSLIEAFDDIMIAYGLKYRALHITGSKLTVCLMGANLIRHQHLNITDIIRSTGKEN